MTRRSSVRAQARRIYRDLATAPAATSSPCPSPQGEGETSLTTRVRALYEDSAVPVREIAAIAGVTERTIYKYAAKQRWQKRYRFAPEKGAGGRFIRRADEAKPIATGLKATDPAGAQRAAAGCQEAARLSRAAQAEAQRQQRVEARIHAMEWTNSAAKELRDYREARQGKGLSGPLADHAERVLTRMVTMALNRWESLMTEEQHVRGEGGVDQRGAIGKS